MHENMWQYGDGWRAAYVRKHEFFCSRGQFD